MVEDDQPAQTNKTVGKRDNSVMDGLDGRPLGRGYIQALAGRRGGRGRAAESSSDNTAHGPFECAAKRSEGQHAWIGRAGSQPPQEPLELLLGSLQLACELSVEVALLIEVLDHPVPGTDCAICLVSRAAGLGAKPGELLL